MSTFLKKIKKQNRWTFSDKIVFEQKAMFQIEPCGRIKDYRLFDQCSPIIDSKRLNNIWKEERATLWIWGKRKSP